MTSGHRVSKCNHVIDLGKLSKEAKKQVIILHLSVAK